MAPQPLLLTSSSLLMIIVLLQYFLQSCHAICTPSACGIIRNICYPFRLKHDPTNFGDHHRELVCENNVTSIYLNSHKYYVKAINYHNFTIRVVDSSINNDDSCSFPSSSAYAYNFSYYYPQGYPFDTRTYSNNAYVDVAWPINFMSCPRPLKNSSLFTDISHDCASINSSHPRFTYIKVGHMNASEVPETCAVDLIVMTSWEFNGSNTNVSLSEIHQSLLHGFQLIYGSSTTYWEKYRGYLFSLLGILVLIVGLLCALVSPPVLTIIGLTAVTGLTCLAVVEFSQIIYGHYPTFVVVELVIGFIILTPRIIIFPIALYLFIYKFRRRNLSLYNLIERFLQSDNKLIPIRYSYSDIKKITRNFQDKLGEGGNGSVYKGKLRSGHDVAVKILGKSGANGQDFMNEIGTIGRIHHVNVVKLVGYCAQGIKRALVFDFMPNGSLEKYFFSREKKNFLNWDTKFKIAVGIARGIQYLHLGCDIQILHFDIKPHNILLDDKFIPKISDFGLAKFYSTNKNAVTLTTARGTIGYVAPELINRSIGEVSYKADVYSFGMVLIEMVNLKSDMVGNNGDSSQYFPCWIYDHLNREKGYKVRNVDEIENHDDNDGEWKLARKMTIVALWCIQMNPDDRPSMNKVLEMLEDEVEHLQIPNYPSQSPNIVVNEAEPWDTCSSGSVSLFCYNDAPSVKITIAE